MASFISLIIPAKSFRWELFYGLGTFKGRGVSGFIIPIREQKINYINPIADFMKLIRMILLKGSTIADIYQYLLIMLGYGIGIITLAIVPYRKASA
jgi:hypothetical protein